MLSETQVILISSEKYYKEAYIVDGFLFQF